MFNRKSKAFKPVYQDISRAFSCSLVLDCTPYSALFATISDIAHGLYISFSTDTTRSPSILMMV